MSSNELDCLSEINSFETESNYSCGTMEFILREEYYGWKDSVETNNYDNNYKITKSYSLLKYVIDQYEELILKFIEQDPISILYSQLQTPKICMAAVSKSGFLLENIYPENRSREVCMSAVTNNSCALKYVNNPDYDFMKAVIDNGNLYILDDERWSDVITPDLVLYAYTKYSHALNTHRFSNIKHDREIYLKAVQAFPRNIVYIRQECLDDDIIDLALSLDLEYFVNNHHSIFNIPLHLQKKYFSKSYIEELEYQSEINNAYKNINANNDINEIIKNTKNIKSLLTVFRMNVECISLIDENILTIDILKLIVKVSDKYYDNIKKFINTLSYCVLQQLLNDGCNIFKYIDNPDVNMCTIAVKKFRDNLQYITHQNEEIIEAAMKKNPHSIEFVHKHHITHELCMMAIKKNGDILQYVDNNIQTYEMCKLALQNKGDINHVAKHLIDYDLCFLAAKNTWDGLINVHKLYPHFIDEKLFEISIKRGDGYRIIGKYPEYQTYEIARYVVLEKNVESLKYIRKDLIDYKLCMDAAKFDSSALKYIEDQDLDICLAAMDSDKFKFYGKFTSKKFKHIKNDDMKNYCIDYLVNKCIKSFGL